MGAGGDTKTKTVSLEEASSAFTAQWQKRLTVVGAEMCKQNTKVATKVARIKAQKNKKVNRIHTYRVIRVMQQMLSQALSVVILFESPSMCSCLGLPVPPD